MQRLMTLNVQGAAGTPWPDPSSQAAVVAPPPPPEQPLVAPVHHQDRKEPAYRVQAPAPLSSPYEAMRLQAYRRDAAQASGVRTLAAPESATTSTASAPAVRVAPTPLVNPVAGVPEAPPQRIDPPPAPPAVRAVEAIDAP